MEASFISFMVMVFLVVLLMRRLFFQFPDLTSFQDAEGLENFHKCFYPPHPAISSFLQGVFLPSLPDSSFLLHIGDLPSFFELLQCFSGSDSSARYPQIL